MQGGQVGVSQPHDIPLSQLPGMHFIIFSLLALKRREESISILVPFLARGLCDSEMFSLLPHIFLSEPSLLFICRCFSSFSPAAISPPVFFTPFLNFPPSLNVSSTFFFLLTFCFQCFSSLLVNTSTLGCLFCGAMSGEAEK